MANDVPKTQDVLAGIDILENPNYLVWGTFLPLGRSTR